MEKIKPDKLYNDVRPKNVSTLEYSSEYVIELVRLEIVSCY